MLTVHISYFVAFQLTVWCTLNQYCAFLRTYVCTYAGILCMCVGQCRLMVSIQRFSYVSLLVDNVVRV